MANAETSARQRQWAACAGIHVDESASYEQYRAKIDKVKVPLRGKPVAKQLRLAESLGLSLPDSLNGWEVAEELMRFCNTRAWVYSVCRKLAGAKWKNYSASGVSDAVINEITRGILDDNELQKHLANKEIGEQSSGDAWCRTTKTDEKKAAFQLIAARLGTQLAGQGARRSASKPASRTKGSEKSGCVVALAATLSVAVVILFVKGAI